MALGAARMAHETCSWSCSSFADEKVDGTHGATPTRSPGRPGRAVSPSDTDDGETPPPPISARVPLSPQPLPPPPPSLDTSLYTAFVLTRTATRRLLYSTSFTCALSLTHLHHAPSLCTRRGAGGWEMGTGVHTPSHDKNKPALFS